LKSSEWEAAIILPPLAVPMDEEPSAASGWRAFGKKMNEMITELDE
jgi:hypothetical protein